MSNRVLGSRRLHQFICFLLAFVTASAPSAALLAQQPNDPPASRDSALPMQAQVEVPAREVRPSTDMTLLAAQDSAFDVQYVTQQAVALVTGRPHGLLTAPGSEMLPHEIISVFADQHLGFHPADVDQFVLFIEPPSAGPPGYALVVKFLKPFDLGSLKQELTKHTQPGELAGKPYLQSTEVGAPSFFMPNPLTLIAGEDGTLRRMLSEPPQPKTSPLLDRVRKTAIPYDIYAVVDVASTRMLINSLVGMAVMQAGDKFPAEMRPFLDAPNLISAVEVAATLSGPGPSSIVVYCDDDAAAEKLERMVGFGLDQFTAKMKAQMENQGASEDPMERAAQQYSKRLMDRYVDLFRPTREGANLVFFRTKGMANPSQQQLTNIAVIGILVALLLPAVQAAREAARRNESMNNLKQLMLSLHNYHDAKRAFPAHAIYSQEGKPLLSWRVQVLPYLEEGELYRQFHLDEPWDSPHNRELIGRMPAVFANPNISAGDGRTDYLAVVGKECIFDGTADGIDFRKITDGTSNTVMLVEADADRAVVWTKPDDWQYDAKNPRSGLGGLRPGGWLAGWADGHVSFVSDGADDETLRAWFTRAGGERVDAQ